MPDNDLHKALVKVLAWGVLQFLFVKLFDDENSEEACNLWWYFTHFVHGIVYLNKMIVETRTTKIDVPFFVEPVLATTIDALGHF